MTRKIVGLAVAAALAGTGGPARAAHYLPAAPLADAIRTQPRDCGAQATWRMPIITWGADEVTLFANGGIATRPGSLLAGLGLDVRLTRVDDFTDQVRAYLACESPFLRATLGMVAQAADVTEADPRTRGVTIYQHSWSAGGDVMVARADVRQPKDLKGRVIVLQQDGPHVDYLLKILSDAGLAPGDVTLRFTHDLTGKGADTPMAAMASDGTVGAVMVISPDAATLTAGGGGNVGTGAEGSVKGAHVLLSTRSANRIITDVIVVRHDFYEANRDRLAAFGKAMYDASDHLRGAAQGHTAEWAALMTLSAATLLDDPGATDDAQGLWSDAEISDRQGNARFFADPNYPRSFERVGAEAGSLLRAAGLSRNTYRLMAADWDWPAQTGVADATAPAAPRFDPAAATRAVTDIAGQGRQGDDTLFQFPVHFQNGQKSFPREVYQSDFDRVIELANTYAGAVITVEGHADPQAYLAQVDRMKQTPSNTGQLLLTRLAQGAKNLSIERANAVVAAAVEAAKSKGVALDPSQFVTQGLGYDQPTTGMCGDLPCRPKNEAQAASNRVVVFRVVNVEAETDAFAPTH